VTSTSATTAPVEAAANGLTARGAIERPLVRRAAPIVAIAILFTLPLLLPAVLPLTDLGGHVGRYAVQLDAGRDPQLAQWYTFRWMLLPNLGADLLVQLLAPLLGLEPAVRVIAMLAVFLQAMGILATSRALHGRITPFAVFALPFVYGRSFLYGFLNYTLALGLLWCSLALWVTTSNGPAIRRRWVAFAAIATLMWTCHLAGWALLCIAVGSQELMRQRERQRGWISAAVASIGPLSCLFVPWAIKLLTFQPSAGAGNTNGFFHMLEKVSEVFQIFEDQWFLFDVVSAEIIALLIAWSWLTKWTRLDRGMMLAAFVTAICVIVVPERLLGSFFADQRLIEPALLFFLLAIGFSDRAPARLPQAMFAVALLFTGVRLVGNTVSLWQLGNRAGADLTVIDALPQHAQMVTFRALRCPPPMPWMFDRSTHLSGYALARRHAFSNDQWDTPGAQLLKIHNPAAGPFSADGSTLVFETPCHGKPGLVAKADRVPAAIPYLWVMWSSEPKPLKRWEPIARDNGSVLYRRRTAR
jgi:hypothetical protein